MKTESDFTSIVDTVGRVFGDLLEIDWRVSDTVCFALFCFFILLHLITVDSLITGIAQEHGEHDVCVNCDMVGFFFPVLEDKSAHIDQETHKHSLECNRSEHRKVFKRYLDNRHVGALGHIPRD